MTPAVLLALAALAQDAPIDRAAWLSGCWELRAGARVTIEMWMPPGGGAMLGASRTSVGGNVREFEFLRLRTDGTTLVYVAQPSGQKETEFRGTHASDTLLAFENPAHDFPQRIMYRRRGADSVVARIEGPGRDGATRGIDFPMRRARCESGR
jgi:hypothetical protein